MGNFFIYFFFFCNFLQLLKTNFSFIRNICPSKIHGSCKNNQKLQPILFHNKFKIQVNFQAILFLVYIPCLSFEFEYLLYQLQNGTHQGIYSHICITPLKQIDKLRSILVPCMLTQMRRTQLERRSNTDISISLGYQHQASIRVSARRTLQCTCIASNSLY